MIRREGRRLRLAWRASLLRLPVFTQRTAVLLVGVLVGVLVATLAPLGAWSRWSAGRGRTGHPAGPR